MSRSIEVALKDEAGQSIGVTATVAPGDGPAADRIEGWSTLQVDGEAYTYSKARAATLLARFPHFVAQIEAADGKKGDAK